MLIEALFIGVGFILVLTIALKIPGVELLVKPIFGLLQKLLEYIVASAGSWLVWLIQCVIGAHRDLLDHLCHDEEHYDVWLKVERANRRA